MGKPNKKIRNSVEVCFEETEEEIDFLEMDNIRAPRVKGGA